MRKKHQNESIFHDEAIDSTVDTHTSNQKDKGHKAPMETLCPSSDFLFLIRLPQVSPDGFVLQFHLVVVVAFLVATAA